MKIHNSITSKGTKKARSEAVRRGNGVFSVTYKDKDQQLEEDQLIDFLLSHRRGIS